MKLIFVRHAETAANNEKRLAIDSEPLNENGLKQAEKLAEEFNKSFDVIFSSPLKRATQTAEIIAEKFGLKVILEDLLREKSYGSLSGKSLEAVQKEKEKNPTLRDFELGYNYEKWGGESGLQVKARLLQFIEKVKTEYTNKKILVITHGAMIRMMHILYSGREYSEAFPIFNISIHEFNL